MAIAKPTGPRQTRKRLRTTPTCPSGIHRTRLPSLCDLVSEATLLSCWDMNNLTFSVQTRNRRSDGCRRWKPVRSKLERAFLCTRFGSATSSRAPRLLATVSTTIRILVRLLISFVRAQGAERGLASRRDFARLPEGFDQVPRRHPRGRDGSRKDDHGRFPVSGLPCSNTTRSSKRLPSEPPGSTPIPLGPRRRLQRRTSPPETAKRTSRYRCAPLRLKLASQVAASSATRPARTHLGTAADRL